MKNYKDLKTRSITALVFALLTSALYFSGVEGFAIYMVGLVTICAYEWGKLSGLKTLHSLLYCIAILTMSFMVLVGKKYEPILLTQIGAFVSLLLSLKYSRLYAVTGVLYFVSVIFSLIMVLYTALFIGTSIWWVFIVILWGGVVVTDIFAYIMGRSFGIHKLATSVSPGKTIEGLIGGCAFTGLYYVIVVYALNAQFELHAVSANIWGAFGFGAFLAFVAQAGDLYQSKMKRLMGVKDSGTILPGHGGMFDRLDGLLAVLFTIGMLMPVFIGF